MASHISRRKVLQWGGLGIGLLAHENLFAAATRLGKASQSFQIDVSKTMGEISPLLFGHNLEHLARTIWQGLSAQMLANRKFTGASLTDRGAITAEYGFFGMLGSRGEPGFDGQAAHWYAISGELGAPFTNFYVDDELSYAGRTSQRMDVPKGLWGGIGQAGLSLVAGTPYELSLILRTHFEMACRIRMTDQAGKVIYFQDEKTWSGNEWHRWTTRFSPSKSDPDAKLEILFKGPGSAWLGVASLLPADNFRGLRKDVIEALKEVSIPFLRWPGGNFTRNWRWKEGLLPADRRPPVMAKLDVGSADTDNYDFQELGIDDFLALCDALGAEPSLTLNLTDELQNACDLVEYCNGPVTSTWGKVRADRGHPEPYGVRYWSLGNENWGYWMGPSYFPPEEYAKQVNRFAEAMYKVDPSIQLVGAGRTANINSGFNESYNKGYTEKFVAASGKQLDLISVHHYDRPGEDIAKKVPYEIGRMPTGSIRKVLRAHLAEIKAARTVGSSSLPISYDEWNVLVRDRGLAAGMYAASALNLIAREAPSLRLHSAMFFQPIGSCISVLPHSVNLTAMGQVFRLFRAHHGNTRLAVRLPDEADDLDLCASLDQRRNRVLITLLNRNPTHTRTGYVGGAGILDRPANARLLTPADISDPAGMFEERALLIERKGGRWGVSLPPYSIALVELTSG